MLSFNRLLSAGERAIFRLLIVAKILRVGVCLFGNSTHEKVVLHLQSDLVT